MKCDKCGNIIDDNYIWCPVCGTKRPKNNYCNNCGTKIEDDSKYCKDCGSKVDLHKYDGSFYILVSFCFSFLSLPLCFLGLNWLSPFCIFISLCVGIVKYPKNNVLKILVIVFFLASLGCVAIYDTCMSCPG